MHLMWKESVDTLHVCLLCKKASYSGLVRLFWCLVSPGDHLHCHNIHPAELSVWFTLLTTLFSFCRHLPKVLCVRFPPQGKIFSAIILRLDLEFFRVVRLWYCTISGPYEPVFLFSPPLTLHYCVPRYLLQNQTVAYQIVPSLKSLTYLQALVIYSCIV